MIIFMHVDDNNNGRNDSEKHLKMAIAEAPTI